MLKFKIVQPTSYRLVVKLRGDLSGSRLVELRGKVVESIKALLEGFTVAFEMSEVGYIDSMGISTLIDLYDSAKAKKIRIEIQNPNDYVLKMLKAVKVDRLFRLID